MPGLMKKIYNPILFDVLLGIAGAVAIGGVLLTAGNSVPAIEAAADPLRKGATLIGAIVASAAIIVVAARYDQKMADDFLFHTITKSSFIGMMTFIFAAALWEALFVDDLGGLSSSTMIGMAVAALSLSWFYTRIRGTRA